MNRILIAAIAALSFATIASAQQAPSYGNGSTRIGAQSQTQSPSVSTGFDSMTTSSIGSGIASSQGGYDATVMKDDLHR